MYLLPLFPVERSLRADRLLVVAGGYKAFRRALADLFGNDVFIQRLQVRRMRNVSDYLIDEQPPGVKPELVATWAKSDVNIPRKT